MALLWRSCEALGAPIKTTVIMVGNWSAKKLSWPACCGQGAKSGQDGSSNGIACWSVALGDWAYRLGAVPRMLPSSHLPLAKDSSLLAKARVLPPAHLVKHAVLFDCGMELLTILDLRDPGRPLWAGVDQPPDRHWQDELLARCVCHIHWCGAARCNFSTASTAS